MIDFFAELVWNQLAPGLWFADAIKNVFAMRVETYVYVALAAMVPLIALFVWLTRKLAEAPWKRALAFIVLDVLVVLPFAWPQFRNDWQLRRATSAAEAFQGACRKPSGCVLAPDGWVKTRDAAPQIFCRKDDATFCYSATQTYFNVVWRVRPNEALVASGGLQKELSVNWAREGAGLP